MNAVDRQLVYDLYVRRNLKLYEVRRVLINDYGNQRGFSIPNIERYIRKWHFQNREVISKNLDSAVGNTVCRIGGSAGGRFVKAYLEGNYHVKVGRRRVYASLQAVDPISYKMRRHSACVHFNPQTYHAPYFGYNLHMDQNEKLGMYGVCIVAAIDGKSFMIVSAAAMFIKNNIVIYDQIYRKAVQHFGLQRQVIVDHGTEFYLTLDMHQKLHTSMGYVDFDQRYNVVRQVPSPQNNRIERLWVEVNHIIIYPLKTAIRILEFENRIDCSLAHHLYSISQVLLRAVKVALDSFIRKWNAHNIQGKGRPEDHAQSSRTLVVDSNFLLMANDAAAQYPGELTEPYEFGQDLLLGCPEAIWERDSAFDNFLPRFCEDIGRQNDLSDVGFSDCYDFLYSAACNHFYSPLQTAVLEHIRLSEDHFDRLT